MNINFPVPPGNITQIFIQQVLTNIKTAFQSVVSKDEAAPRILLSAPNGTVYQITVDNSGTIHTAVNDGKTRV